MQDYYSKMRKTHSHNIFTLSLSTTMKSRELASPAFIGRQKRQKRGLVTHQLFFLPYTWAQVQFMCYKVPRTHNAGQLRARLLLLLTLPPPLLLQLALLGRGNRSE